MSQSSVPARGIYGYDYPSGIAGRQRWFPIRTDTSGWLYVHTVISGISISGISIDVSGLEDINRSGFMGIWDRLDVKISEERSGFQNTWSGLNEIRDEVIQLQDISRSGFLNISISGTTVSGIDVLQDINRSGFQGVWSRLDEKINQEYSGFADVVSEIVQLQTIEYSGLNDIATEIIQLQTIENSGFDNLQTINYSGLNNIETEITQLQTIENSGLDTITTEIIQLQTINNSGLDTIATEIVQLQTIENSGLDTLHSDLQTKIMIEQSGFQNVWSGLNELETIDQAGFNVLSGLLEEKIRVETSGFQRMSGFVTVQNVITVIPSGTSLPISGYVRELPVKDFKFIKVNADASGNNTIISTVANKTIKVYNIVLITNGAVICSWQTGGSGISGPLNFPTSGWGYSQTVSPPAWLLKTYQGSGLQLNLDVSGVIVGGYVNYWDSDSI